MGSSPPPATMLYSLEEIEKAMQRIFVHHDICMGVEIITRADEGTWFKTLFNDIKKELCKEQKRGESIR